MHTLTPHPKGTCHSVRAHSSLLHVIFKRSKAPSDAMSYDSAFSASLALHFNACKRTVLAKPVSLHASLKRQSLLSALIKYF